LALAVLAAGLQADGRKREVTMRANVGDELTVRGTHQGDEDRHGEVIRIDGTDGAPPYLVRWRDGHESVFFPASGTEVTHHPAKRAG
jgi:Domain of unknown function (DUF1918)